MCVFGFNVAFNNLSIISRRCLVATGSSVLTFIVLPHWSIMSQTLGMIPHPVTLSWHWVDQSWLYPVSLSAKRGAASTIFTTLVCRGPGSNPWSPVPRSGHSTNWAIGAGVIRGKNTNMWPLLNNSCEFSVLKKKKISLHQWKREHLKKKEHTEKGINYDISSTQFRVWFAILCSSIDRYQVDQQALAGAWP